MLPAADDTRRSLADVLPATLSALAGEPNALELPGVRHAVVLLVDGLGAAALRARLGHARTLASRLTKRATLNTVFPTTTAAALASLTTGAAPGRHGLVGYSVPGPRDGALINQLSGWGEAIDPATWQRLPTVFERAGGVRCVAVGAERYRDSGFTRAVLRGAEYRAAGSITERVDVALELLRAPEPTLVYLYVPELDSTAHAEGWQSEAWTARLEELDAAVATLERGLAPRDGLLVTADHGVVDVPAHQQIYVDETPELLDGVRLVAGEPRCLQLHLEPGLAPAERADVLARWRDGERERAWVASRDEAIAAGWFGDVHPDVAPRIGDILVAARKQVVYYDRDTVAPRALAMVGQHGSWTDEETIVPLLRFGAFAR